MVYCMQFLTEFENFIYSLKELLNVKFLSIDIFSIKTTFASTLANHLEANIYHHYLTLYVILGRSQLSDFVSFIAPSQNIYIGLHISKYPEISTRLPLTLLGE